VIARSYSRGGRLNAEFTTPSKYSPLPPSRALPDANRAKVTQIKREQPSGRRLEDGHRLIETLCDSAVEYAIGVEADERHHPLRDTRSRKRTQPAQSLVSIARSSPRGPRRLETDHTLDLRKDRDCRSGKRRLYVIAQAVNTRTARLLSVPVESQPHLSSNPAAKRGVNSAYPGAERSRTEHVTSRSHDAVCVGLYESNSAFTCALIWGRAAPREIVTLNAGIPCFRGCLQPICIACEVHDELS
jgi:hypothetical protein